MAWLIALKRGFTEPNPRAALIAAITRGLFQSCD
jgi:hypothetical protein